MKSLSICILFIISMFFLLIPLPPKSVWSNNIFKLNPNLVCKTFIQREKQLCFNGYEKTIGGSYKHFWLRIK